MASSTRALLLSLAATAVSAEYGHGGDYGPVAPTDAMNYGPFGGWRGTPTEAFINSRRKMLVAHGVLAALAFVIFFPVGAILVRLGSFRGMWLIHGLFQTFAYLVYIAAFGIGVWMVNSVPVNLLDRYHPIIGILVFVLLFFQPILGFVHHLQYKKYSRRTVWSYGHLWLGRVVITLGMINGGLGLLLASDSPAINGFVPKTRHVIAYGAVAGVMWLLWVAAAILGERRRARARKVAEESPPTYKEIYAHRMSNSS